MLVDVYTIAYCDIDFAIGNWSVRGCSGSGVTIGLSGGILFMGRHTGLATFQVLYFCPHLTFANVFADGCLVILLVGVNMVRFIELVLLFPIIGKHVQAGFEPCVLRN